MRPPFVDAHVHFWDLERLRYPWLTGPPGDHGPALTTIAHTYLLDDYLAEAEAWNVAGLVHVEAGVHDGEERAETVWLQGVADARGLPSGLVVCARLNDPDLERALQRHLPHKKVRGVRHIINWRPGGGAHDGDLAGDPAWERGYALLERLALSFDFHGFPPQLANLAAVAERHPGVSLVLNHLALPTPGDAAEMAQWRAGLAALARLPQAAIKLSGAGFMRRPLDPAFVQPFIMEAVDRFGPDRVMVATNFPTDRMCASLDATLGAYEAMLAPFSEAERRAMWGENANRIYRLGLDL